MSPSRSDILAGLVVGASAALVGVLAWVGSGGATDRVASAPAAPVDLGAAAENRPLAPQPPAFAALVGRGAEVYAANCFACHGGSGDGQGPQAPTLSTPARDFTDSGWMAAQADGVMFSSVQRGVAGTPMPAFAGRLSAADTWAVVAYLRGFSPQTWLDSAPGVVSDPPGDGGLGTQVYAAQCAGCHGDLGAGDGPAAGALDPPPRDLADRGWIAGHTDDQLAGTLVAGVPGTAMPSFADTLDPAQMQAVIDHLRQLAGGVPRAHPVVGPDQQAYLAYCASCHGANGDGDGIAAGRIAPVPRDFRNPAWMAGQTDEGLVGAIRDGRPGTAMPPFADLLSEQQIAALAAYVRGFAEEPTVPGAGSAYRYDPSTLPGAAPSAPPDPAPTPR